jgi:hypothetical protein
MAPLIVSLLVALAAPVDPAQGPFDADGFDVTAPAVVAAAPAALPPAPSALPDAATSSRVVFDDVDPVAVAYAAAGAVAGSLALAAPVFVIAATTGIMGAAGVVGALAGWSIPLALSFVAAGYFIGVPAFFVLGPLAGMGAALGALVGGTLLSEREMWPALIGAAPAVGLAVLGSVGAFVGTTVFTAAFLGLDTPRMRASGSMMMAGLITSLLAGPVAVVGAVLGDAMFGAVTADPVDDGRMLAKATDLE